MEIARVLKTVSISCIKQLSSPSTYLFARCQRLLLRRKRLEEDLVETISKIGSMISNCVQTIGMSNTTDTMTVGESSITDTITVGESSTTDIMTVGESTTATTTARKKRTFSEATKDDVPANTASPEVIVSEKS